MPPLTSIRSSGECCGLHALALDGRNINPEASVVSPILVVGVDLILDPLDSRLVSRDVGGIRII